MTFEIVYIFEIYIPAAFFAALRRDFVFMIAIGTDFRMLYSIFNEFPHSHQSFLFRKVKSHSR